MYWTVMVKLSGKVKLSVLVTPLVPNCDGVPQEKTTTPVATGGSPHSCWGFPPQLLAPHPEKLGAELLGLHVGRKLRASVWTPCGEGFQARRRSR